MKEACAMLVASKFRCQNLDGYGTVTMSLLTVGKHTFDKVAWEAGRDWDGSYEYMAIRNAMTQTTSKVCRNIQIYVGFGVVKVIGFDSRSQWAHFRRSRLKDSASEPGGSSCPSIGKFDQDLSSRKDDMAAFNVQFRASSELPQFTVHSELKGGDDSNLMAWELCRLGTAPLSVLAAWKVAYSWMALSLCPLSLKPSIWQPSPG